MHRHLLSQSLQVQSLILDMLQGFWINFSTDPNKALQNLKSFPCVSYTSRWSHAWFLNRLCTFVWFTDLPFPLPLVLFVLLPLSSGKLVLIFWDLNKCALGPELVALSSGLSYYSANSSTMLITMGIKFICLCLSLLPSHWVSIVSIFPFALSRSFSILFCALGGWPLWTAPVRSFPSGYQGASANSQHRQELQEAGED